MGYRPAHDPAGCFATPRSYALGARARAHHCKALLDSADVVLPVGTRTGEQTTNAWTLFPPQAKFIHTDVDGQEIARLKRLLAEAMLDNAMLKDIATKKW